MATLIKQYYISSLKELPRSAVFYKRVNGKDIYKDIYDDKFYIVERKIMGFFVQVYKGECTC